MLPPQPNQPIEMDYNFSSGIALGIVLALTPGPVVVETMRRSATVGLRSAIGVSAGAAIGNLLTAALAALGVGALIGTPRVARLLTFLSAGWLTYLALGSWRQAQRATVASGAQGATIGECPGWLGGFVVVVANPVVWAFWLAAMTASGHAFGPRGQIGFAGGFVVGMTVTNSALAVACHQGGRQLGPGAHRVALRASALLLFAFAVLSILGGYQR